MNSMDEKLWEYIDGGGNARQRADVEALISKNVQIRQQYEELLQLHTDFGQIETDEPSMAFTYNVMEHIRTEEAAKPLKAGINRHIIWGIAAFFLITISTVLIYLLAQINWQSGSNSGFKMPEVLIAFNNQQVDSLFSGPLMKGFLFFDVIFGLFLFDAWLRRRKSAQQHQQLN